MTPTPEADEDFEFLVNLLASDGADPDHPTRATGSQQVGIQRGSDGKLDLGQVKAFYENKNMGVGVGVGAGVRDSPELVPERLRDPLGTYKVRFPSHNCTLAAALRGVGFRKRLMG